MLKTEIKLSVHELVDFLFRSGDIDNRVFNLETMRKGSEIHRAYQEKSINCLTEYQLVTELEIENYKFIIQGSADLIIADDIPIIEEIKSTNDDLDHFYKVNKNWHLSQAIVYAYMYLKKFNLSNCKVRLIYISQINKDRKRHNFKYNFGELEKIFISYLISYIDFYKSFDKHKRNLLSSIETLNFPYKTYRKGQKEFMKMTYDTAIEGGISYIEAPTGIGKTISSIYPTLKALRNNEISKTFYLTAKNMGKLTAYNTYKLLIKNGLLINVIYITAKDKMCINVNRSCNPKDCPYARSYYNKLNNVIREIISNKFNLLNSSSILEIAKKYEMCPFELSLDLSNYMDVIIADYNYFFDPIAKLERYFDLDSSNYFVLVDEVHNLVSRGQEMYSETISYYDLLDLKREYSLASKKVKTSINKLIKLFLEFNNNDLIEFKLDSLDEKLYSAIFRLNENIKDYLKESEFVPSIKSSDISKKIFRFLKLYENFDTYDVIYINKENKDIKLNLFCIDPSKRIGSSLNSIKGAVMFSATLNPIDHYIKLLGGDEKTKKLILSSPFPRENFNLEIADISIKYKDRINTLDKVVSYIKTFIQFKKGNYFIFVPSFEYLELLKNKFDDLNSDIYFQDKEMSEFDKLSFLSHFTFQNEKTTLGIIVLGGMFSESIDLNNDSLNGVIVIGVGLPKINFKTNLIKEYFDSINLNGYSYAYKNPGMNKVTQAVGRLIRDENDVGTALLIDDRFLTNQYKYLFKENWKNYTKVSSEEEIIKNLKSFYKFR